MAVEVQQEAWQGYVGCDTIRPPTCPIQESRLVIAVLKHDQTPSFQNKAEDFFWANASLQSKSSTIRKAYEKKYPGIGQFYLRLSLKNSTVYLPESIRLYLLPGQHVPGLIVIEAVLGSPAANETLLDLANIPNEEKSRSALSSLSPNIRQQDGGVDKTSEPLKSKARYPSNNLPESSGYGYGMVEVDLGPIPRAKNGQYLPYNGQASKLVTPILPPSTMRRSSEANSTPSQTAPVGTALPEHSRPTTLTLKGSLNSPSSATSSTHQAWGKSRLPSPTYQAQPTPSYALAASPSTTTSSASAPPMGQSQSKVATPSKKTTATSSSPSAMAQASSTTSAALRDIVQVSPENHNPPSTRIPDQSTNLPFLKYLDHYHKNFTSSHALTLSALVDVVWNKWSNFEVKSDERTHFIKLAKAKLSNMTIAEGSEMDNALNDVKPIVPKEADDSQREVAPAMLNFQEDFEPIESASTVSKQEEKSESDFSIQALINGATLEELETYVQRGVRWLEAVSRPLKAHGDRSDSSAWLKRIDQIKSYAARTKTVIGVVGNTGAGKSSVINAMLDEEQLLPTNTMRACTAVVTELSYNWEEGSTYRAVVEFIDEKSWRDELKILFSDLIDENGDVCRDSSTADSDAGIAYAKIKAVYPKKTKEDIANSSIDTMIKEVSHILGKESKVSNDDPMVFYKRLQKYIDSQEKITNKNIDPRNRTPREMEFWPLIKVVKIYCKSSALETGATIVDLPGVHDANAARAAVAEGYMKQCSGLWIVAPIIRAVDDKAAKTLLGETFKRQLKMDGGFNQVSFICSKTDDISLIEATASLGLEAENQSSWKEIDAEEDKQKELDDAMSQTMTLRDIKSTLLESLADQREVWENLQEQFEEGTTVYAPRERKRKAFDSQESASKSKKKQKRSSGFDDDDDFINDDVEDDQILDDSNDILCAEAEDDDEEVSIRKPLTEDEINDKVKELREQAKDVRRERVELNAKIKQFKQDVKNSKQRQKELEVAIAEKCIRGRNDYSKQAIQQDFAAGIRELDQETAQEEDEDNFNPDEDARDYEEVARSLPVFCVSSRGYQQLKGKLIKDAKVSGFTDIAQTEVPALQEHCKQLTVSGRTAACKKFLVTISALANSLTIWSSSDGTNNHLTQAQKEQEEKFLSKSLNSLDSGLDRLGKAVTTELETELETHIFGRYGQACKAAEDDACQISNRWGAPYNSRNRTEGGLHFQTYRAVIRRFGCFTNASGPIDFNGSLSEPMMMQLVPAWERVFSRRIPAILNSLGKNLSNLLKTFHNDVAKRSQLSGVGIATLPLLEQQLENYEQIIEDVARQSRLEIDEAQRNVNREFVPSIKNAMLPGYERANEESGAGMGKRMKQHMADHISTEKNTMFRNSCKEVQVALKKTIKEVYKRLEDASDEVYLAIERDYKQAFNGNDLPADQPLPKWHREMRKAIQELLEQLEAYIMEERKEDELAIKAKIEDDNANEGPAESEGSTEAEEDPAAMQLMQEDAAVKAEVQDNASIAEVVEPEPEDDGNSRVNASLPDTADKIMGEAEEADSAIKGETD